MYKIIRTKKGGFFNNYIHNRINNNKNFIACITGPTGSGKSLSALKFGESLDPDFNEDNVVFEPEQFMDLLNNKTKKLHKGSVIVFDELQISMGHLDFHGAIPKMLNFVLQTFRYMNIILIITTPNFYFVNASARKLFHSTIETAGIDKSKSICKLIPYLLQINQRYGKIYYKYLQVKYKGRSKPIETLSSRLPSEQLIKRYEIKKDIFVQSLNKRIREEIRSKDEKRLTLKQKKTTDKLKMGMKIHEIAKEENTCESNVYQHIKLSKKKGCNIDAIKDGVKVLKYVVGNVNF